uniref:Uncharacterized protein n=1 Tax=Ditylenchus dipsaci TaxID=166011 RepID=A0A915DUN8_9BILA
MNQTTFVVIALFACICANLNSANGGPEMPAIPENDEKSVVSQEGQDGQDGPSMMVQEANTLANVAQESNEADKITKQKKMKLTQNNAIELPPFIPQSSMVNEEDLDSFDELSLSNSVELKPTGLQEIQNAKKLNEPKPAAVSAISSGRIATTQESRISEFDKGREEVSAEITDKFGQAENTPISRPIHLVSSSKTDCFIMMYSNSLVR